MDNELINQRPFPNWGHAYELGHSNDNEDNFVISYFENKVIDRKRLVVDIGAADGLTGSNSRKLIVDKDWNAILIEPFEPFFNYLKKLYSGNDNVTIFNNAIDIDEKETLIYYKKNQEAVGLTSLIKNSEYTQKIVTKNFNNLIEKKDIDFLSIDAEGKDYEILTTINFNSYNIEIICVEKTVSDKEYNNKIINFLIKNNYSHVRTTNHNFIFTKI